MSQDLYYINKEVFIIYFCGIANRLNNNPLSVILNYDTRYAQKQLWQSGVQKLVF